MKIKAIDVAKALGISKATVSLALNNKSGISEETKQKILQYKQAMEQDATNESLFSPNSLKTIKIILYVKHGNILQDQESPPSNVLPSGLESLDRIARSAGFTLNISYFHEKEDNMQQLLSDCKDIDGIFLEATEMFAEDFEPFKQLNIPILIYDNDFEDLTSDSIILNNPLAIKIGLQHLYQQGHRDVLYLYNSTTIYNFIKRRESFHENVEKLGFRYNTLEIGTTFDEVYKNMKSFLEQCDTLPSSLFSENYVISMGVMKALKECGYRIPDDISLIGIDEIPPYILTDVPLTTVRVLQKNRAIISINRLIERINKNIDECVQIVVGPEIIIGKSVKTILGNHVNKV